MSSWTTPPEHLTIMPTIRVFIMGSFRDGCLKKLESVRDGLIEYGFSNSRISLDFNYPPRISQETREAYNLRMSEYWLQESDIQIFVFFKGTDNVSVCIELCTHLYDPRNSVSTIVGCYDDPPSLLIGLSERHQPGLSLFQHSSIEDIVSQSAGQIVARLSRFYQSIKDRGIGGWELYSNLP